MPLLGTLYRSIRLRERIPADPSRPRSTYWVWSYPPVHLLTAADMPPPWALCHSIHLSERIPMSYLPTRSDHWVWSAPPSWLWLPGHLPPRLRTIESYSHATASSLIPFNSSPRADSNEVSADPIRPLVVELPAFLTLAARGPPTQT